MPARHQANAVPDHLKAIEGGLKAPGMAPPHPKIQSWIRGNEKKTQRVVFRWMDS
jgi:hypothetical protein